MNNINFFNKIYIYIFLFIIFGFIIRYFYFLNVDGWFDEWNMLYTIDPNISNQETWKRYYGDRGDHFLPEYYPPLNAFFLKFILNIFGYNIENARFISLIFGCGSLILVFNLSKIFTNYKFSLISTLIVALNLFLIWQSSEIRPHSFVVFFSLLTTILFLKIYEKNFKSNKSIFITYIASSLILLSSWPFVLIIFLQSFFTYFNVFYY